MREIEEIRNKLEEHNYVSNDQIDTTLIRLTKKKDKSYQYQKLKRDCTTDPTDNEK